MLKANSVYMIIKFVFGVLLSTWCMKWEKLTANLCSKMGMDLNLNPPEAN